MLVLTRKTGERIAIGDNIKITVLEIKGDTVRLGIEAPRETQVYREEIFLKIQEENRLAATAAPFDPAQVSRWTRDRLSS